MRPRRIVDLVKTADSLAAVLESNASEFPVEILAVAVELFKVAIS